MSTGHSASVPFEPSDSSSTLVGEEDGKDIQDEIAHSVLAETEPSNSSRQPPAQINTNEEDSMDDIQESLSLLWQTSQCLAVWMAALITALISGLQILQPVLAQENQKPKRSIPKSGEISKKSEDRES